MVEENEIKFKSLDVEPEPAPEPKKRGRPKGSGGGRRPAVAPIKEGLMSYVALSGTSLMMFPRTRADGKVILERGEPFVDSLLELGKQDRRVMRALQTLVTGGAWGSVLVSGAAIALPIAANHGLLPGFMAAFATVESVGNNGSGFDVEAEEVVESEVTTTEGPSVVAD